MWGGTVAYAYTAMPALIKAFTSFNIRHIEDPDAAVILAYVWLPAFGGYLASVELEHSVPALSPPILKNFTDIPALNDGTRIVNLTTLTEDLAATQPAGSRCASSTTPFLYLLSITKLTGSQRDLLGLYDSQ